MSEESVRYDLVAAGFEFVQLEPALDGTRGFRPDVLAWAANADGDLVPWAVVEILKAPGTRPEIGLTALVRSRDLLGTIDHYVVVDGVQWYSADAGLQRLSPVDGPAPPRHGGTGQINDGQFVSDLIGEQLSRSLKTQRRTAAIPDLAWNTSNIIGFTGFRTTTDAWIPASTPALWEGRRRAISRFERTRSAQEGLTSQDVIARAVARLAGNRASGGLLDPFCGTGAFLWEAIDHADASGRKIPHVVGIDINERIADLARLVGEVAPVPVEIRTVDVLQAGVPASSCIVTAPPVGLRLPEPVELADGSRTRNGDLAVLDSIIRAVQPGGRAVVHAGLAVTSHHDGDAYRRYLASSMRVAALIGLPAGAMDGTSVRSVLVVIDRDDPADTFVAHLGDDWQEQIGPDGAAIQAATEHLDGTPQR